MRFSNDWLLTTLDSFKLVKSNIIKVNDELNLDPTLDGVAEALGFVYTNVDRHDGEIISLKGVLDLETIGELDEFPLLEDEEGPAKWYSMTRFAGKHIISKEAHKWFMLNQTADTLPDVVKQEINKLANQMVRLPARAKKARNFFATRVFLEGFNNPNPTWPGSSTPYGNPLFFNAHPVGTTWETQSNIMEGADRTLDQVNLEKAIEKARGMKDGNGTIVGFSAPSYTLIVWPKGEANARKILNDWREVASQVADVQVNNDVTMSIFQMNGFKINLMVLPTMGQPSLAGKIGTGNEWFLLNQDWAREAEAFRFIPLYEAEIDSYVDKTNKTTVIDIDMSFTMDCYNPEVVIGSDNWANWTIEA